MTSQTVPIPDPGRVLPRMAGETSAENPWPLSQLSSKMAGYIQKMPAVWVEAQVVEYKQRPGTRTAFFVVRDIEADVSINVQTFPGIVEAAGTSFDAGARVVMHVKPNFWEARGSLSLRAQKIFIQGEGDLLAQIDKLRRQLASEGLFEESRKHPLPFLPRAIGLICGRNAKAKEDVLVNAKKRWPGAHFVIREVAVQGVDSVGQVGAALSELSQMDGVDVIVITRGGGSVEDLLPFSDEKLVRFAASVNTPIVSAIGHEEDVPLLDLVADYRASTPTDAARRIVPDIQELTEEIGEMTARLNTAISGRLLREREILEALTSRPVLTDPTAPIVRQLERLDSALAIMRAAVARKVAAGREEMAGLEASLRVLSPAATLARGYAILRTSAGNVVTDVSTLKKGDLIEGAVESGTLVAQVFGTNAQGTLASWAEK